LQLFLIWGHTPILVIDGQAVAANSFFDTVVLVHQTVVLTTVLILGLTGFVGPEPV
jgi:hypothetical protein